MSAFEEVSADLTTMSLVDACSEFLMCARYGEDEDLLAMLSATYEGSSSIPINHADTPSGNTALHLACANGHTSTVQLLLAQSGMARGTRSSFEAAASRAAVSRRPAGHRTNHRN